MSAQAWSRGPLVTEPREDLVRRLAAENDALRAELWSQWEKAHAEYCDVIWPHIDGSGCEWPPPRVLFTDAARYVVSRPGDTSTVNGEQP
jgi:hypothetical protein